MTQLTTSREAQIRQRMKQINVAHRSYFIKSPTSIRLCHLEPGYLTQDGKPKYKYLVFPFCDSKAMQSAAQILKECGIVDGFRTETVDDFSYVVLTRQKLERHVDGTGVPVYTRLSTVVEWSELSLTRSDVQLFIATFESKPEKTNIPIRPMFPRHTTKQVA